jgi:Pyruvate/2-oxoacid:ferredoxin oxidoreductase delta subunit
MREMSDVGSNGVAVIQSTTKKITKKTGGWIEMKIEIDEDTFILCGFSGLCLIIVVPLICFLIFG